MNENKESAFDNGKSFVCERVVEAIKGVVEPNEHSSFYYLGS